MSIKDHVQGTATFQYARDGSLWYETDTGVLFEVPFDDTRGTTFNTSHKSIHLMRWIRKAPRFRSSDGRAGSS